MRWVFLLVGWGALGLGLLGIFLPLLPTTPFLLAAAFCFSKASPQLHARLLRHPLTGPVILDWRERGAIRPRVKLLASALLVPTVLTATYFSRWPIFVNAVLLGIVVAVFAFLWTRPSR